MLACSSGWIFSVFWGFFLLSVFLCICLGISCRRLSISLCMFLLFRVLGLKSLLASIFLIFELDVLGLLLRVLIFLFVFLFCLLIGWSSFHSIGRCYILGIFNICLVLWLFFFYRCNFRCLVCFSLYCSWFRFPSVDCIVL